MEHNMSLLEQIVMSVFCLSASFAMITIGIVFWKEMRK